MKAYGDITVVAIDGRKGIDKAAVYSVIRASSALPGSKRLLISPDRPGIDRVDHRQIAEMGYFEYSQFVLFGLWQYIETEFALIVQADGFVLNPGAWDDRFMDWDIVGAPIHLARIRPEGHTGPSNWLHGFDWVPHANRGATNIDYILNGGFSLRSKKALKEPYEAGLYYSVPPCELIDGRMIWKNSEANEDVQLCALMRCELEKRGVRFAPLEVAKRFALEHSSMLNEPSEIGNAFGLHGTVRRLSSIAPLAVSYNITRAQSEMIVEEHLVIEALKSNGFIVNLLDS